MAVWKPGWPGSTGGSVSHLHSTRQHAGPDIESGSATTSISPGWHTAVQLGSSKHRFVSTSHTSPSGQPALQGAYRTQRPAKHERPPPHSTSLEQVCVPTDES